jgi:hypothetical protein
MALPGMGGMGGGGQEMDAAMAQQKQMEKFVSHSIQLALQER